MMTLTIMTIKTTVTVVMIPIIMRLPKTSADNNQDGPPPYHQDPPH